MVGETVRQTTMIGSCNQELTMEPPPMPQETTPLVLEKVKLTANHCSKFDKEENIIKHLKHMKDENDL